MAKAINAEKRAKIVSSIKNGGVSIIDASKTYGVTEKTIRKWLRSQTRNAHTSSTEVEKLRKENQALKALIGEIVLNQRLKKKSNLLSS